MALGHLSEKLVDLERRTRADIFNAPTERVIAQGRLLLCALSMFAIQFDPTQPTQYAEAAQLLVWIYFALAAILVALTRYRFLKPENARSHSLCRRCDHLCAAIPDRRAQQSVFRVFYLRAPRGHVALAMASGRCDGPSAYGGASHRQVQQRSPADIAGNTLNTEIIRGAYLIVAGGMLAYASAFYKRSRERFAMLAPWPMRKPGEAKVRRSYNYSRIRLLCWKRRELPPYGKSSRSHTSI